jgi:ubiquinone/menaquinone biosynthesis C-methylase UbiE
MTASNKTKKQWNEMSEYWTTQVREGRDSWREYMNAPAFKKMIGDVQGLKLLDLACGEGYFSRFFSMVGADVTGVDFSEKQIAAAEKEESKNPLGIRYFIADASKIDFLEPESFDIVICFMALMDIEDYENTIMHASRVLKTEGRFVFIFVHPCFGWSRRHEGTTYCEWEYKRNDDGSRNPQYLKIWEYFTNHPYVMEWRGLGSPESLFTTQFHRTITDYVTELNRNGFVISQIIEPRPMGDESSLPSNMGKLFRIPHTICIEALKNPKS